MLSPIRLVILLPFRVKNVSTSLFFCVIFQNTFQVEKQWLSCTTIQHSITQFFWYAAG